MCLGFPFYIYFRSWDAPFCQKKSKSMYPNVPIYDIMNKGLAAVPGSSNHSILSQPSAEFSNLIKLSPHVPPLQISMHGRSVLDDL